MDKNTITGLVLMVLVMIGFGYYNNLEQQEIQAAALIEQAKNDSIAEVENKRKEAEALEIESQIKSAQTSISAIDDSAQVINSSDITNSADDRTQAIVDSVLAVRELNKHNDQYGIFVNALEGDDQPITFETDKFRGKISKKGGFIYDLELKDYHTYTNEPLVLFDLDSSYYSINLGYKNLETKDFYFTSDKTNLSVKGDDGNESITLTLNAGPDKYISYTYKFYGNDFKVDFDVVFHGLNSDLVATNDGLAFEWNQLLPSLEKTHKNQQSIATIYYYNPEEGRDYVSPMEHEEETLEYPVDYLAMRHQYFTSCLVPDKPFVTGAKLTTDITGGGNYFENLNAKTAIPFEASSHEKFSSMFVFAPADFKILASYDANLEDQIDYGWGIISWMNIYFVSPVFHWIVGQGVHIGLAILLITLLIKMILFPITYKNYLSSAKMRVIKPQLEKINEENKDADAMKKQQAVMALYKETGVNPMAGCIPAILQMPILFAMFRFFPNAFGLRQESFLWADDLSTFDSVLELGFNIPFYGSHVSLFTILMAVSLFFYTKFNNQMTPSTGGNEMQMKQMKIMMNFMPLMMLFFFNSYAAGLSYYYFLANVITIGQTVAIKKFFVNETAIMEKIEQHKKKPMKTSKWQKKMQEIAEKQKQLKK